MVYEEKGTVNSKMRQNNSIYLLDNVVAKRTVEYGINANLKHLAMSNFEVAISSVRRARRLH